MSRKMADLRWGAVTISGTWTLTTLARCNPTAGKALFRRRYKKLRPGNKSRLAGDC
ncbi:hypothetical protein [Photorhabdus aegyptia]|uniref:hypothetical protein n=1 Tax=Photorhabdus aegyptia TaxID=2805098 RepID=UPI001E5095A6|nr:hypothetical protein [Photorhabdus aegyptia]MCC8457466.1 hypothetical protein [Photorhabdus aegyptia]